MKQMILCFSVFTFYFTAFGQLRVNNKMVGGNFNFYQSSAENRGSGFSAGMNIELGKAIATNLFAGISMNVYGPLKKDPTVFREYGGGFS